MDLNSLEHAIQSLVEPLDQNEFIYDFLRLYEFPKSSITRLKKGDYNQSKNKNELLWKKNVFFKVEKEQDLHLTIDDAKKDQTILKQNPRFMIVTDFNTLLAIDTKIGDTLDISFSKLSENYAFFLPWAGMEKTQIQSLNLADVKAAEKLAQLYDIIIQENHIETEKERHALNIFLSRLLFCLFAEDTGIFKAGLFTNAIASHTQKDGSDLQDYLIALFKIMNIEKRTNEPAHIKAFPYVNGGLFAVNHPAPKLNAKARKMIIDAGKLNWKQINPDIFGSMMQAVVHSDQRGSLGMHYTSVANIMKVIEPLFLNDLKEQLKKAVESEKNNEKKLTKLLDRLYHLRLFDPACGSGNFLIIAYKELCRLEIEIFKQLQPLDTKWNTATSGIRLTQFYGIELDDFAHETAKLSLWLAEHQMNLAFKDVFGSAKPTLPLQDGGHIVCGNATRKNWGDVCPKEDGAEIYILGNPPYLGARNQSKEQKEDMKIALGDVKGYNNLDYISCWFIKASKYIRNSTAKYAFVSTNSISQGTQVAMLWPHILDTLEIFFAHQSFKWTNNAKGNAGVTCVVVGVRASSSKEAKYLFNNNLASEIQHINAYLSNASDIYIQNRRKQVSSLNPINYGSFALDDGNYTISKQERELIISRFPNSSPFLKRFAGAKELIQGGDRYCVWIENSQLKDALKVPVLHEKIEKVRKWRLASKREATKKLGANPHRFAENRQPSATYLAFPTISSERRTYIPIAFLSEDVIASNQIYVVDNAETYTFSIISSRIHMTWVRAVAGRLKTDYRYSSALCYNTFPFPDITKAQKTSLEDHVFNVLDEREKHPEKTMAELYDPDKMPKGLRQAHHDMDLAVEQCYRKTPFKNDEERLEYLFKLYEKMIAAEKINTANKKVKNDAK
ncbi:MAG: N-6 DNA methylase [Thiomicrorhabdus sp.]|nr:N-6 DNA methylase [Thiomicrorhabdus sp.]